MTIFAHIETGQVLDPQENDTAEAYLARYAGAVTVGWKVVQVPAGTQHNAVVTLNADETYTFVNPTPPTAPAPPTDPYLDALASLQAQINTLAAQISPAVATAVQDAAPTIATTT